MYEKNLMAFSRVTKYIFNYIQCVSCPFKSSRRFGHPLEKNSNLLRLQSSL